MKKILLFVLMSVSVSSFARKPELYANKVNVQLMDQVIVTNTNQKVRVRLLQDVKDPKTNKIVLKKDEILELDVSGVDKEVGSVSFYKEKNKMTLSSTTFGSTYSKDGNYVSGVKKVLSDDIEDLFCLNIKEYVKQNPMNENFVYVPQGSLLDLN